MTGWSFVVALAACALLTGVAATGAAAQDVRIATVDGHRQSYVLEGRGAPALVMFAGLGDDISTFAAVAHDLAADATVLRIDRAGYGKSEPSGAQDIDAVVSHYHAVVEQAGVKPPYVVLGHSLGGMYAEYYAAKYPEEVAGLVLEDSRAGDFTSRCLARLGPAKCVPPAALVKRLPKVMQAEIAQSAAVSEAVSAIRPAGGLPVLILTRGGPTPDGAEFQAVWLESQDALSQRYPGARHFIIPNSGHYLHVDAKEPFESHVKEFLEHFHH